MRQAALNLSVITLIWTSAATAVDHTPAAIADPCPADASGVFGMGSWVPPFLRDTAYGQEPIVPGPESPAEGHLHYPLHPGHYGVYHRPGALAEDCYGRWCDDGFTPRGKGHPYRRTPFRMDYHRYVVKELPSVHGPSYYKNNYRAPEHAPLQGCKCCRLLRRRNCE